MSDPQDWIGKLEAEISRELGQAVTLIRGDEASQPDHGLWNELTVPGATLALGADRDDLVRFLAEARVIDAGQADAETVRELWSGILASAAAGLGGRASPAGVPLESGKPWVLRLGNAGVRLSLTVDAAEKQATAEEPRPAVSASAGREPAAANFDLLLEVELDASVRFGSRELELKEVLELGPGDVVELDRQVADPVDLIVGDRIVARGEVVLVNGNFGLRVTEVVEPVRRLESIRCQW
jgi:flagellar motor switch protein FliN